MIANKELELNYIVWQKGKGNMLSVEELKEVLEYDKYLSSQETDKEEPRFTVLEVLSNEDVQEQALSLVHSIYLAFPGFEPREDLPAVFPYDPNNQIESAAAAAYFQYVKELHGTTHKNYLKVEECIQAFDASNYKEDELPFAFHEMSGLGVHFLSKVYWMPELWIVPVLQKQAQKILDQIS